MRIKELGELAKKIRPRANMIDPSTGQAIVSLEKERREKKAFFQGFGKAAEANSLIGTMKGLQSGIPKYEQGGDLNRAPSGPNPGVAVAPKSDMPPLPTMVKQKANRNLDAALPFKRVKIPKPPNK